MKGYWPLVLFVFFIVADVSVKRRFFQKTIVISDLLLILLSFFHSGSHKLPNITYIHHRKKKGWPLTQSVFVLYSHRTWRYHFQVSTVATVQVWPLCLPGSIFKKPSALQRLVWVNIFFLCKINLIFFLFSQEKRTAVCSSHRFWPLFASPPVPPLQCTKKKKSRSLKLSEQFNSAFLSLNLLSSFSRQQLRYFSSLFCLPSVFLISAPSNWPPLPGLSYLPHHPMKGEKRASPYWPTARARQHE